VKVGDKSFQLKTSIRIQVKLTNDKKSLPLIKMAYLPRFSKFLDVSSNQAYVPGQQRCTRVDCMEKIPARYHSSAVSDTEKAL